MTHAMLASLGDRTGVFNVAHVERFARRIPAGQRPIMDTIRLEWFASDIDPTQLELEQHEIQVTLYTIYLRRNESWPCPVLVNGAPDPYMKCGAHTSNPDHLLASIKAGDFVSVRTSADGTYFVDFRLVDAASQ